MLNVNDESDDHEQCCTLSALPLKPVKKITGTPAGATMKAIEYAPQSWFLLTDGKEYYLDISCNLSIIKFSLLIKLTNKEMSEYQKRGTRFLHILAKIIQHSPTTHYNRNQSVYLQRGVIVAIAEWHKRLAVPS